MADTIRLDKIVPKLIGPFHGDTELKLDPNVTVITGANDVGKSCLLKIIFGIFEPKAGATENSVNRTRLINSGAKSWRTDQEIGSNANFCVMNNATKFIGKAAGPNVKLKTFFHFAPDVSPEGSSVRKHKPVVMENGQQVVSRGETFRNLPKAILIDQSSTIGSTVNLNKPTKIEKCFLEAAFGTEFSYSQIESLDELNSDAMLESAEETFSGIAKKVLPDSFGYRFRFRRLSSDPSKLSIIVKDANKGMVPFGYRGSGAKKLLGLFVSLISFARNCPCVILIDEPENSLHADAQRALRSFLEELGERDGVQVVYSTHSPTMINHMKANSLRLLTQESDGHSAKTRIDNSPIDENLRLVRTSLGIVPSDSLLYSDIGIIVEGLTECLGLPELFIRLEEDEETYQGRFERASSWLSNVHFINGLGDNFERICKLAKGQGCNPLIFVDGDKIKQIRQLKLAEHHPEVPVIHLPDGIEFEQIIPIGQYFVSVAQGLANNSEATVENFESWKETSTIKNLVNRAFSKQVDLWHGEQFDRDLEKPQTMLRAIRDIDLSKLKHVDILEQLHIKVLEMLATK